MKKLLYGILLQFLTGCVVSLGLLFFMVKKEGKKLTLKRIFSVNSLIKLSKLYDVILSGLPHSGNPVMINVFSALKATNDLYSQLFEGKSPNKLLTFLSDEGFTISTNPFIYPLIMNTKLKTLATITEKAYEFGNGVCITSIVFPDGDKVYVSTVNDDEEGKAQTSRRRRGADLGIIALSKDFNLETKLDLFWNFYPDGIFIHNSESHELFNYNENSDAVVIEPLPHGKSVLYGDMSKKINVEKINKFIALDIQRSYLLIGRPGTGKSETILDVARQLTQKIVKISAELFRTFNPEDVQFIFKCLRPKVVIIDDFDKVFCDSTDADILYFFESLKKEYGNVVVFSTVNSIERMDSALLRPGRFDEIFVFHLPKEDERKMLIQSFIQEYGVKMSSEEELDRLVKLTKGFSQAYIKEFCLQLRVEPNFQLLAERIEITRQFISPHDFSTPSGINAFQEVVAEADSEQTEEEDESDDEE